MDFYICWAFQTVTGPTEASKPVCAGSKYGTAPETTGSRIEPNLTRLKKSTVRLDLLRVPFLVPNPRRLDDFVDLGIVGLPA